jgi:hypothetical protein
MANSTGAEFTKVQMASRGRVSGVKARKFAG